MKIASVFFRLSLCAAILTFPGGAWTESSEDKVQFAVAEQAVAAQDWDSAMDAILTALTIDTKKDKYVELLLKVAPQFFSIHEQQARQAMESNDISKMQQHCALMTEAVTRIKNLNLMEGRGKKKKELVVAKPTDEMLNLCIEAPEAAARQKYNQGLEMEIAGSFRDAAIAYRECLAIKGNFEDAAARYSDCRGKVLRRIALASSGQAGTENNAISDTICAAIKMSSESGASGQASDFEFTELVDAPTFRSQAAGAGVALAGSNAKDVARAAKKLGGIERVLLVSLLSRNSGYTGATFEDIRLNNDGSCIARVYKNDGLVTLRASYELVDVKTGNILKSGDSGPVEEKDEHHWAEVGSSGGRSGGGGFVFSILRTRAHEAICAILAATDPRVKDIRKNQPGSPLPETELTKRAAEKVANEIGRALSGLL